VALLGHDLAGGEGPRRRDPQDPETIQIGRPRNPIETITQHFYPVYKTAKIDLLLHMLRNGEMDCVLVFSRTKHGADKIHRKLDRAGIQSVAMHSDRSQGQRERAMDGFKRGKFRVMVATDIAARGIDIDGISHVINYDVPAYPEDYIHRIGRTGRAAATGDAITFVSPDEEKNFRQIEKFIGREFEVETCPGFDWSAPDMPASQARGEEARLGGAPAQGPRPKIAGPHPPTVSARGIVQPPYAGRMGPSHSMFPG
jgi:ATP-dependent RNA helicase RhlE